MKPARTGRRLAAQIEDWPLRGAFRISRGAKTEARVVVVSITENGTTGRGESVPYPRYGETPEAVCEAVESVRESVEGGMGRDGLQAALPPGAARNAVDCALWDLEAKRAGRRVWQLAGLPAPRPCTTALTLGLDTPENMGRAAAGHAAFPLLKLKVAGEGDLERVRAVRENAPAARIIVDANEGWRPAMLDRFPAALHALGVELIEQPLPAGEDDALAGRDFPIPICADESCHTAADLPGLVGRYQAVNVKLDKTGGLTEALALIRAAPAAGFHIMVGCMVGTSLAMAPATLLAHAADHVDLDGPLLMARDRAPGLRYDGACLHPPDPVLWG